MSELKEQEVLETAPAEETSAEQSAPVKKKRSKWRIFGRIVGRFFALVGVTLLAVLALAVGAVTIICRGPSPAAAEVFVNTVMETSAAKFIAHMYFTEEEVEHILYKYAVIETDEVTVPSDPFQPLPEEEKNDIVIEEVHGQTYHGYMMIIRDPSRVQVAALERYDGRPGKRLEEFYEDSGAVAIVNAGGFYDAGGQGNGGSPQGIVIHDSKLLYGSRSSTSCVIGFDQNDRLVVGRMTGQQALDRGLRDAVSFGPVFVVNGKPAEVSGNGGGLNPRTVIGQREDGSVLLLVIEGRLPNSLGASYKDCIDVMLDYGAVNAGNLDGGSSSLMIYNGEHVNTSSSLYGSRQLPDAIVVMPAKGEE